MANTANFSLNYKARIVKTIVGSSRTLHAFGVTSKGQAPSVPTTATISAIPGPSTLGSIANGNIAFAGRPTIHGTYGAEKSNTSGSAQLMIPAGYVVHYVGLAAGSVLYTFVELADADNAYYYEEQGTLTIPTGGYTVRHA